MCGVKPLQDGDKARTYRRHMMLIFQVHHFIVGLPASVLQNTSASSYRPVLHSPSDLAPFSLRPPESPSLL